MSVTSQLAKKNLAEYESANGKVKTANSDHVWLKNKNFKNHTFASKSADLHPGQVKELKKAIRLLKDENRHLRESMGRMKKSLAMRSTSPIKGLGSTKKVFQGQVGAMIASQKFAQQVASGLEY